MIDPDLLLKLDAEIRIAVVEAFKIIMDSGIIELQQDRLLAQLKQGALDESDEQLASRIKVYRSNNAKLLALKQLGELIEQKDDLR